MTDRRHTPTALALAASIAILAAACGGDSDESPGNTTDTAPAMADTASDTGEQADTEPVQHDSGSDTGSPDDGGVADVETDTADSADDDTGKRDTGTDAGDTGSDDAGEAEGSKSGSIVIVQTRDDSGVEYSAVGGFAKGASSSCTTTASQNNCEVVDCSGDDDPGTDVSAGTITVTGGTNDLTMQPTTTNSTILYSASNEEELWDGTQTLTFSAAGDTVPAFSTDVSPPADVTLQSPALPAQGSPLQVDASSDLDIEWDTSNLSSGRFTVLLGRTTANSVRCDWSATSGSQTIPSSLLSDIEDVPSPTYSFSVEAGQTVTTGDYEVAISTGEKADDGDSSSAGGAGDLTFQ